MSSCGSYSEPGSRKDRALSDPDPSDADLDPARCAEPPVNTTKGAYEEQLSYLGTHFSLLREDFVRPLRGAVQAIRSGREAPREVRLWPDAAYVGAVVGEPGGILHRIRLTTDASLAEALDLGQVRVALFP